MGRRGLEPLTPCASCKCATNCANGPSQVRLSPPQGSPVNDTRPGRRYDSIFQHKTATGHPVDDEHAAVSLHSDRFTEALDLGTRATTMTTHGTKSAYNRGCRCDACREASRLARTRQRQTARERVKVRCLRATEESKDELPDAPQ